MANVDTYARSKIDELAQKLTMLTATVTKLGKLIEDNIQGQNTTKEKFPQFVILRKMDGTKDYALYDTALNMDQLEDIQAEFEDSSVSDNSTISVYELSE